MAAARGISADNPWHNLLPTLNQGTPFQNAAKARAHHGSTPELCHLHNASTAVDRLLAQLGLAPNP